MPSPIFSITLTTIYLLKHQTIFKPGQVTGVGHDAVVGDVVSGHHPHGRATVETHPGQFIFQNIASVQEMFGTLWSALHWVGEGSGRQLSLR